VKNGLRIGDQSSVRFVVDEGMVAAFEGRIVHRVLSTFHLVYYSELAARKLIEPFLDEGEDAAGIEICLKHIAPTEVGDRVEVTAKLKKIDGREIVCDVAAVNSLGKICNGTQIQKIIRKGVLGRQ
jgi:fluoroacetyl-CoA thioesterase